MQDRPLTVRAIFEHGSSIFSGSEVATAGESEIRRTSYAAVAQRAARLAGALRRLGIRQGDRVATFCWNTQEHLEAYFAVPTMGAVLHTLNVRLFPEQLAYIANHAEDRVIIVDSSLIPVLAKAAGQFTTVEKYIILGGPAEGLAGECFGYEDLLSAEQAEYAWPEVDERSAASMCYTSGTTGNPKGVVYSHRSIYLHSLAECSANTVALSQHDRILVVPSMFHACAWGLPYAGWLAGSDFLFPGRYVQAEPLCRLIEKERPTVSAAVPTVLSDVMRYADTHRSDLSSLRAVLCGGSAVPRTLIERFEQRHGARIIQAWGMTETSPLAALAFPPGQCEPGREMDYRAKTGRVVAGVELRVVDDGRVLPWDGQSIGELQIRGPWITGSYYGEDTPDKFDDGWLRTGDVGTMDSLGYIQITDRSKDVIKSGGEWVSSVDLENEIMAHPDVLEAAVIGVPDPRWDERPLACVVLRKDADAAIGDLRAFLEGRVAKWWIPERWALLDEIPKTSVGKFDKKVLRARREEGALAVVEA